MHLQPLLLECLSPGTGVGKSIKDVQNGFKVIPRCNKDERHIQLWVDARNRVDEQGGLLHGIMHVIQTKTLKSGLKQHLIPSVGAFERAEQAARTKKVREMRAAGKRRGNTTPSEQEIMAQLKGKYQQWTKLQTKQGSKAFKEELLNGQWT